MQLSLSVQHQTAEKPYQVLIRKTIIHLILLYKIIVYLR